MGVAGACRGIELCQLLCEDVQDIGTGFLVNLRNTKNNKERSFIIKNSSSSATDVVGLCRKYIALKPKSPKNNRFFVFYKNGKCGQQPIGKNMFGQFPQKIARFLNLPNPHLYTGHCFRRTSASILADSGVNIEQLKRHGGWKSGAVAEGYVERSMNNKKQVSEQIFAQGTTSNFKGENYTILNNSSLTSTSTRKIDTQLEVRKNDLEENGVLMPIHQEQTNDDPQENISTQMPHREQKNEVASMSSMFNFANCSSINLSVNINHNYRS